MLLEKHKTLSILAGCICILMNFVLFMLISVILNINMVFFLCYCTLSTHLEINSIVTTVAP